MGQEEIQPAPQTTGAPSHSRTGPADDTAGQPGGRATHPTLASLVGMGAHIDHQGQLMATAMPDGLRGAARSVTRSTTQVPIFLPTAGASSPGRAKVAADPVGSFVEDRLGSNAMDALSWVLLVVAFAALVGCGWLLALRAKSGAELAAARREIDERNARLVPLEVRAARAEEEARRLGADAAALTEKHAAAEQRLADAHAAAARTLSEKEAALREQFEASLKACEDNFKALAGAALSDAQKQLLDLAQQTFKAERGQAVRELEQRREAVDTLIKPIAEALKKTDEKLGTIEKTWTSDRASLGEQLRAVTMSGDRLREETSRLASALRDPNVRGRYGEVQLRRVVEIAGMTSYCDFTEQDRTVDSQGNPLRPDMIIRLPGERCIIVDAKANLKFYLEALSATDAEAREQYLRDYARQMVKQASDLAKKKYYAEYDGSPDFVVMFVPGDGFLDAALANEPDLLELAARQRVVLASPATLIGLLRAVALALQEQRVAEQARELRELGRELHDRACIAFKHLADLGGSLGQAVERYNKAMGSVESRLVPTLRKFEEGGAGSGKTIPELPELSTMPSRAALPEA